MNELIRCRFRMQLRLVGLAMIFGICGSVVPTSNTTAADGSSREEDDGTIHVPAFSLPESSYLSNETRAALKQLRRLDAFQIIINSCPSLEGVKIDGVAAIRRCQAEAFYRTGFYKDIRSRYPIVLTTQRIHGVYTEIFTPKEGIPKRNEHRVLINLHGGSFSYYARINSHLESIPVASVGKIKVISIDYRQAPEYTFPAATKDIAEVYRELLKTYSPKDIGLYGCSAGGVLTAESIVLFEKQNLPLPGAIGMFCAGADRALDANTRKSRKSDSGYFAAARTGDYKPSPKLNYFRGVDMRDALVNPGDSDEVMSKFPPSLLISGTRDMALSSVVVTHAQLVRLGVETELHVWEGMDHAFHYFPQLPESREAYDVIVKFFDVHLGK